MDDQRGSRPDDRPAADGAEGVRIIGADEAAEAIERGEVAPRRADDEPRFGDRPPAPPDGPRPALRFPLDADADPTHIERPPVEPAPDPVTGPVSLPHWTEPPTGEVPAVLIGEDQPFLQDDEDDLEVWSSFATSTPRWRDADDDWSTDDGFVEQLAGDGEDVRMGALADADAEPLHEEYFGFEDMEERVGERIADSGAPLASADASWEDDWSASEAGVAAAGDEVWVEDDQWADEAYDAGYDDPYAAPGPGGGAFGGGGGGAGGTYAPARSGDRDMGSAILVGVALAAVGLICLKIGGVAIAGLAAAILVVCAFEYFEVLRKVGWESARLVGLVTVLAFPLAVYWRGVVAYPILVFLLVGTVLSWYLSGAGGTDPRVLEGSGATMLGVLWIGGLGSAAAEMAKLEQGASLLLIAIIATIGYDVGALFIGKAMGHRPLSIRIRSWRSPPLPAAARSASCACPAADCRAWRSA